MAPDRLMVTSFLDDENRDEPAGITQLIGWRPTTVSRLLMPFEAVDFCAADLPASHLIFLNPFGMAHIVSPNGEWDEIVVNPEDKDLHGTLHGIRFIGKHVYAVGMHRQCYRRELKTDLSPAKWSRHDGGMLIAEPSKEVIGFFSIDGFTEEELYATGWQGEIWQYDRREWVKRESGTNLLLEHVSCCPDGNVYAVGKSGLIIRGRHDEWMPIDQDATTESFEGLVWYRDHLWLSTRENVFRLNADQTVSTIDFGSPEEDISCGRLVANGNTLWSIGTYDVFTTTDGENWTRVSLEG